MGKFIPLRTGDVYKTNSSGDLVIKKYNHARDVVVTFVKTGYETTTRKGCIEKGGVRDPHYPSLYGAGYIGEGSYTSSKGSLHIKAYRCWNHMIERCYSEKFHSYHRYGGKGVTVCDDWLCYQTFAKWYYENYKEGQQLDKDILNPQSNCYSPDNCCFVPLSINTLFTQRFSCRGDLPIGVSTKEVMNSFMATLTGNGISEYLGSYSTPEEAFQVYKVRKTEVIRERADLYFSTGEIDLRIKEALYNYEILPFPQ